jgi:hypothetical protein
VVFAAVLTGDRTVAEDAVQDVLIRAHARWPKISALEHPDPVRPQDGRPDGQQTPTQHKLKLTGVSGLDRYAYACMRGDGTRLGVVPRVWPMSRGLLGSQ